MAASATSGSANWNLDDILNGIEGWYNESVDYHWDSKSSYGVVGHWTQGVWAKSRYLGCGYAACDTGSPFGSSFTNWLNVVCKYYPGGNYGSSYPYTEGTKCSDCDADRTSCVGDNSGLCGGDMCLNCAVDYFNADCVYDDSTCPTDTVSGDGYKSSAGTRIVYGFGIIVMLFSLFLIV